jgi:hypothetical protein
MNYQDKVEKRVKKLRLLKQYSSLTDEQLVTLAQEQLQKADGMTMAIDDDERKFAKNLLDKYLAQRSFEDNSERETLNMLIDLEVIRERIKQFMNKESNEKDGAIPLHMLEKLNEITEQIMKLKESLGMTNKQKEEQDFLKIYGELEQKALKYYEEHKGCNTVRCPHCTQLFHLLFDAEKYKPVKATWWKGTVLYNKDLFELYDQRIITKEKLAKILGVSDFYIDLLHNDIYLKEKQADATKD